MPVNVLVGLLYFCKRLGDLRQFLACSIRRSTYLAAYILTALSSSIDLVEVFLCYLGILHILGKSAGGGLYAAVYLFRSGAYIIDIGLNIVYKYLYLIRQCLDLTGNNSKSASVIPCACRLYGRVYRKYVRLGSYIRYLVDAGGDLFDRYIEFLNDLSHVIELGFNGARDIVPDNTEALGCCPHLLEKSSERGHFLPEYIILFKHSPERAGYIGHLFKRCNFIPGKLRLVLHDGVRGINNRMEIGLCAGFTLYCFSEQSHFSALLIQIPRRSWTGSRNVNYSARHIL